MNENRGGANRGQGRKLGSKNKNPKNTSKIEGKEVENKDINEAVDSANKKFIENLSGDMKKLYEGFSKRHKLPLDDLRELAQSLKARYKIGFQTEIEEHEQTLVLAKQEYDEIIETKLLYGRKSTKPIINNRLRKLKYILISKYYISSQLTTLATEIRNIFVEIERIEAGQPKGGVNIFNILQGKGDKKKIDQLEEALFTPDPSILDPEDEDYEGEVEKEVKEETNDD